MIDFDLIEFGVIELGVASQETEGEPGPSVELDFERIPA